MVNKIGDTTTFYDVKARKKVKARITKITKKGGRSSAHGKSKSGTNLRRYIKN